MPIENCDYFVQVLPFPEPIPAFLRLNPDGYTYTMYFNANFSSERRIDDYEHELWHILQDDLFGEKSIHDIEGI